MATRRAPCRRARRPRTAANATGRGRRRRGEHAHAGLERGEDGAGGGEPDDAARLATALGFETSFGFLTAAASGHGCGGAGPPAAGWGGGVGKAGAQVAVALSARVRSVPVRTRVKPRSRSWGRGPRGGGRRSRAAAGLLDPGDDVGARAGTPPRHGAGGLEGSAGRPAKEENQSVTGGPPEDGGPGRWCPGPRPRGRRSRRRPCRGHRRRQHPCSARVAVVPEEPGETPRGSAGGGGADRRTAMALRAVDPEPDHPDHRDPEEGGAPGALRREGGKGSNVGRLKVGAGRSSATATPISTSAPTHSASRRR